jgi:glycerol uptake facilitator-like aquaporin
MDQKLRMYLAELVGTFLVVLVGAGTVCAFHLLRTPSLDKTGIALAEGFALAVALTVTFYVSIGCLNPAVTLMLWVFRRLESGPAAVLILMQLLGATCAGLILRLAFKDDVLVLAHGGAPHLTEAYLSSDGGLTIGSLVSGTGWELFFALVVTLALFATFFDPRAPRLGGILPGLAQAAVVLLGFNLTGGSANPARWFGPAVWLATVPGAGTPQLADALIYVGGPVLGALAAAFLYHALILPSPKRPERHR